MKADLTATYVYCVVGSARPPQIARAPRGLAGGGPLRALPLDGDGRRGRGLFAVVADVPLARYGEQAIARGLSDLDWVSRAAVGHEAVVEYFSRRHAALPMKLFTIFSSDERALEHLRGERSRLDRLIARVADHDEWALRVLMDRQAPASSNGSRGGVEARKKKGASGVSYLSRKKAQRDATVERALRARETVAGLYDRLAARARLARRRSAQEVRTQPAALLLEAAFLVPRSRTASFRGSAAKEARTLASHGYTVTLTGPWPPYSFVQD